MRGLLKLAEGNQSSLQRFRSLMRRGSKCALPKVLDARRDPGEFSLESLESRLLLSVTIQFNYDYDTTGFFGDQNRRNVLQAAADQLTERLGDDLTAITTPTGTNTWTARFANPSTGDQQEITNLQVPADTLIVYVGGRTFTDPNQRGRADTAFNVSGDTAWVNNIQSRGETGALGPAASRTDVAPWGGSIGFDRNTSNWYFGTDGNVPSGQVDFFAVAQHEIGHLLGFTNGFTDTNGTFQPSIFNNNVANNTFTGTHAVQEYGAPVPVSIDARGAHWGNLTRPAAMVASNGSRFTELDFAALDDIGWDLRSVPQPDGGGGGGGVTQREVTLTITTVDENGTPDNGVDDHGDWFAKVFFNDDPNFKLSGDTTVDGELINPNWTFKTSVASDATTLKVRIQLWDSDEGPIVTLNGDNDLADIDPTPGDDNLDFTINMIDGTITGDVTGQVGNLITASGDEDDGDGRADLTFRVEAPTTKSDSLRVSNGALTIHGDQFSNLDDSIILDKTAADGLKVTINGLVQEYAPGEITSITANTGAGNNVVSLLAPLAVDVNGGGTDRLVLGSGLPAATYTPDASGLPGFGTLNVGTTQVHFASLEFVEPVAPDVTGVQVAPLTIDENGVVTLSGTFTDPGSFSTHSLAIDWGDGTSDPAVGILLGERSFSLTHRYLDDNPSGTASDGYTISLRLTDNSNLSDTGATSVTVKNVLPVISGLSTSSPSSNLAQEGQEVTVQGNFTDVGTLDTHTVTVDWGDSLVGSAQVTETGGNGSFVGKHAYQSGGIYPVLITVRDDDTGEASQTKSVFVTGVGVHEVGGLTSLQVVGTNQADDVTINLLDNGLVQVNASFLPEGKRTVPLAGLDLIQVVLLGGDDRVTVAGNVPLPAVLDGGDGNDNIQTGSDTGSILIGGAGNDKLTGGAGRDIQIGGLGADTLVSNGGDDILISGYTSYDSGLDDNKLANDLSLLTLRAEWNSSRSYADRVANLRAGTGPELAGSGLSLRKGMTVFDDTAADGLTGAAGLDWFFIGSNDKLTDRSKTEVTA